MALLTLEQEIANGVQKIITVATNLTSTATGSAGGTYTEVDTQQVLDSLQALSTATTELVSTLTNKSSFFKNNVVARTIIGTAFDLLKSAITVRARDNTNDEQH